MKRILWSTFLVIGVFINAQKHEFLNPSKLTEEELLKSKSLIDENASAEFLYRSDSFFINPNTGKLVKKYFYRIKIYNKNKAEDYLNLEVFRNQKEYLSNLKALTYNLENGKITVEKVDRDSKYKDEENGKLLITKLAFPNVKDGSVIEYSYDVESPYLFSVPEMVVELNIPSVYTEYVLDSPLFILFNINYTGTINPTYKINADSHAAGVEFKTYKFGFKNVKAFKTEKFIKNDWNYRSKIKPELQSVGQQYTEQKISMTWNEISKLLYDDKDFGGQLSKTKLIKESIPADIFNIKDNTKKADAVFTYVKNNYLWNKKMGVVTENGFKKLLETKTGNSGDINLLLVAMLRESGLSAEPVVISTVNNGLINFVFPDASKLNFVLAAVQTKDGYDLYDATSKQASVNELPQRDWNQYGMIFSKEGPKQIQMINFIPSFKSLMVNAKINEEGEVSGFYSEKDKGTFAMQVKEEYDENTEKYKKKYKENFSVDFTDINSKVLESGEFESTMKFSSQEMADRVGKKMIINPLVFLSKNFNEFDQTEERKFPIELISAFTKVKKVVLEIPEGYTIEEMPKGKRIVTEDKEIEYVYSVEQKGNKLEVTSTMKVKSSDYPKEYYPAFKQIWGVASKFENQVISLVKK